MKEISPTISDQVMNDILPMFNGDELKHLPVNYNQFPLYKENTTLPLVDIWDFRSVRIESLQTNCYFRNNVTKHLSKIIKPIDQIKK